jgi:hypothetical protein
MLFIKLDIAKALDSVRWEYFLEIMEKIGFGQCWRDIMALIWSGTTSLLLVNGEIAKPIQHGRGLWQGDPLSPMLFILVMDPLQNLLDRTTEVGLLHPIGASLVQLRTSLYAHDTTLFLHLIASDVTHLNHLLESFGAATGLYTNVQNQKFYQSVVMLLMS